MYVFALVIGFLLAICGIIAIGCGLISGISTIIGCFESEESDESENDLDE